MDRCICPSARLIGPSFYVRPEDVKGDRLILRGEEVHHAVHVRRCRVGDRVDVVNGDGMGYSARIEGIGRGELYGRIEEAWREPGEPRFSLTLMLALLKGNRLDWVVEKATELGVRRILPVRMARTVALSSGSEREERWRRIARSAMKQCGRSRIPEVGPVASWSDAMEQMQCMDIVLVAWEGREAPLLCSVLPKDRSRIERVGVVTGPEGGYTGEEFEAMNAAGFRSFSLGSRRLRAETAAILAIGMVLYECETHPDHSR